MTMLNKDQLVDKFSFQTKTLKGFDSEQSTLCLELNHDSLFVLIVNNFNELILVRHIQVKNGHAKLNLSEAIASEELLKQRFKKVNISCFDVPYTVVPTAFFDESQKEELLSFSAVTGKQDVFLHEELQSEESKLIFSLDVSIKTRLDQMFPNNHLYCGITQLIQSFTPSKKSKESGLIHFRKNAIEVLLHNKKIVFCNTFSIITAEDVLYFLLSAVELNQFTPSEMELFISGEVEKDSIWMKMINKYFNNITYLKIKNYQPDTLPFEDSKQHQFYQLFNLINCE
jgi:hypothetical protein